MRNGAICGPRLNVVLIIYRAREVCTCVSSFGGNQKGANRSPSERQNQELSRGEQVTASVMYPEIFDANPEMISLMLSGRSAIAKIASHRELSILRMIGGLLGPSLCDTSMRDLR